VKEQFGNASIVGNNRVVFNVHGNSYRLVVKVEYQLGIVFVRFVGTHAEYDTIDVETV
jgi:mRNA interferase HigB